MGHRATSHEEYLEQIYRIAPSGRVRLSSLARAMDVKPPSVTEMCRGLAAKGYVVYEARKGVTLTDKGRRKAELLLRRHRLAERMLTDLVGLPWEEAHDEACKYEHVISDEVERLLRNVLPDTCPHGNPIEGTAPSAETLFDLPRGAEGEVVRIEQEETGILRYLAEIGLVPGARVEIQNRAPRKGPLLIATAGGSHAVGREIAERVMVKRIQ